MKSWWKAVVTYPATWVAIALVALGVWIILALLEPPFFMTVILLAIGGIAIVAWPLAMSATGTLSRLQFEVSKLPEIAAEEMAQLGLRSSSMGFRRSVTTWLRSSTAD